MVKRFIILIVSLQLSGCGVFGPGGGVTQVHDPSIIQSGDTFYLFSTGRGLAERSSKDLFTWKHLGRVLAKSPHWTLHYSRSGPGWAPDISFVDGEYRLYYAVSNFGKTNSAIGLCVNSTLDPNSSNYHWIDHGEVIATHEGSDWNAIDPCAFDDLQGNAWMVLGSCWSGLKLLQLDRKTGLLANTNESPLALAAYPPQNIIEEGYVRPHGEYYYLWESVDHCCRGVDSTYRILVGRSKNVRGPYLDRDGKPMLLGGGTLVLASYDNCRGPGSCATLHFAEHDFLVHHEYDGSNRGVPTLQIRELYWDTDGWPLAGEPITRPPAQKPAAFKSLTGDWSLRTEFGEPHLLSLKDNGTIAPLSGSWIVDGNQLILTIHKQAKDLVEEYYIADDGSYLIGRNENGSIVSAVRDESH